MFPTLDAKLKRFEELELQLQDPEVLANPAKGKRVKAKPKTAATATA